MPGVKGIGDVLEEDQPQDGMRKGEFGTMNYRRLAPCRSRAGATDGRGFMVARNKKPPVDQISIDGGGVKFRQYLLSHLQYYHRL